MHSWQLLSHHRWLIARPTFQLYRRRYIRSSTVCSAPNNPSLMVIRHHAGGMCERTSILQTSIQNRRTIKALIAEAGQYAPVSVDFAEDILPPRRRQPSWKLCASCALVSA
jgi:hypothetical protein